jgi:hypothetical protein
MFAHDGALSSCSEHHVDRLVEYPLVEHLIECLVECLVERLIEHLVEGLVASLLLKNKGEHQSGYGIQIHHLGMTARLTMNNGMNVSLNVLHPLSYKIMKEKVNPAMVFSFTILE